MPNEKGDADEIKIPRYAEFPVAVDFDGTIVEHEFPRIGAPVPGAFYWLEKWYDVGATLILWTMRSNGQEGGNMLDEAWKFIQSMSNVDLFTHANCNPQDWTTSPKAYARVYVDDAAFGCPLVLNAGKRPYVDWGIVGPGVLHQIKHHYEPLRVK